MTAVTTDTGYPVMATPNAGVKMMLFYSSSASATNTIDVSSYFSRVLCVGMIAATTAFTDEGYSYDANAGGTTIYLGTGPSTKATGVLVIGI
jgi:hypothetical protein